MTARRQRVESRSFFDYTFFETLGESHNVGLSLTAAELVISVAVLYDTLNGRSGPKVILTFQIFKYLSLREDLREVSTVGIISPQLVKVDRHQMK